MPRQHLFTLCFGSSGAFLSSAGGTANISALTRDEKRTLAGMICDAAGITRKGPEREHHPRRDHDSRRPHHRRRSGHRNRPMNNARKEG